MNAQAILSEVNALSVSERILLVEDLWDGIAKHPEQLPITDAQKAELDRRIANMEASPDAGSSWAEVRARIESA
jgi:putative addiction module component (TIGR02574 family)